MNSGLSYGGGSSCERRHVRAVLVQRQHEHEQRLVRMHALLVGVDALEHLEEVGVGAFPAEPVLRAVVERVEAVVVVGVARVEEIAGHRIDRRSRDSPPRETCAAACDRRAARGCTAHRARRRRTACAQGRSAPRTRWSRCRRRTCARSEGRARACTCRRRTSCACTSGIVHAFRMRGSNVLSSRIATTSGFVAGACIGRSSFQLILQSIFAGISGRVTTVSLNEVKKSVRKLLIVDRDPHRLVEDAPERAASASG